MKKPLVRKELNKKICPRDGLELPLAHGDGVVSEKVIKSGHSTQANSHTIEEIKRILLEHAQ